MKPAHPVLWLEKGFNVLWGDTLAAVALASQWTHHSWISRMAILNSVFCVEAAANCCLSDWHSGKEVPAKIDRFPPVKKFNYYLFCKTRKRLNDSALHVQRLRELIKLRDSVVHRKRVTATLAKGSFIRTKDIFPILKISTNPELWDFHVAKKVLLAVSEFFEFFFVGCCGQTPEQTYALLQDWIDQPTIKQGGPLYGEGWHPPELKLLLEQNAICPKWVAHFHVEPDN